MSRLTKILLLVIGVAIFIVIIAVTKSSPAIRTTVTEFFNKSPLSSPTPTPLSTLVVSPSGEVNTIEISERGFTPSELIINSGDKVNFINRGAKLHWPISEPHPIKKDNQSCQEFELINSAIEPKQLYQLTFNEPKSCSLFDKLNPSLKGTLIVE